jgi:hypothetical protein
MTRPDQPAWTVAKAAGDAAELAVARWWIGRGFTAYKTVGWADHDLCISAQVEVKADLQAARTGHIAVEVEYNGQPSGIATSRATFWALVLGDTALLVRPQTLRRLVLSAPWPTVYGGERRKSKLRLVDISAVRNLPGTREVRLGAEG